MVKGRDHEQSIPKEVYFGAVLTKKYLYSLSNQIHYIRSFEPNSVLEVGKGNGFVSECLKLSGVDVYTTDINCALKPDICCDIKDLPEHLDGRTFDLISCCEVLEHLPFSEFEQIIEIFSKSAKQAFITVPHNLFWLGASIELYYRFDFGFRLPINRPVWSGHYWELASTPECRVNSVVNILRKYYDKVEHGTYKVNSYHYYFKCFGSKNLST